MTKRAWLVCASSAQLLGASIDVLPMYRWSGLTTTQPSEIKCGSATQHPEAPSMISSECVYMGGRLKNIILDEFFILHFVEWLPTDFRIALLLRRLPALLCLISFLHLDPSRHKSIASGSAYSEGFRVGFARGCCASVLAPYF
jgi:hypothetical protein